LGKKIEAKEMKMATLAVLILAADILFFSAAAVVAPQALKAIANDGPHGFTELVYAFSSATGNNGSAFAGLSADNRFLDLTLGTAMILGRFFPMIPVLAIAGSMSAKVATPPTAGTFPTTGLLFVGLLVGVVLIVGALTFFPGLALGPIAEALIESTGRVF
jgi:K+-transporting ATPase ATPase A chain